MAMLARTALVACEQVLSFQATTVAAAMNLVLVSRTHCALPVTENAVVNAALTIVYRASRQCYRVATAAAAV